MTLPEFLTARIAEDEKTARWVLSYWPPKGWTADAVARDERLPVWELDLDERELMVQTHARRVLAECEAKRQIVGLHSPCHVTTKNDGLNWDYHGCGECSEPEDWEPERGDWWPCPTLRLTALPYADHPDFQEDWGP